MIILMSLKLLYCICVHIYGHISEQHSVTFLAKQYGGSAGRCQLLSRATVIRPLIDDLGSAYVTALTVAVYKEPCPLAWPCACFTSSPLLGTVLWTIDYEKAVVCSVSCVVRSPSRVCSHEATD